MSAAAAPGFVSGMSRLRRIGTMLENWKLVRQRAGRVPTWRGWLLSLLMVAVAATGAVRMVHPFLAVTERVSTDVLVVEGWVPDFGLRAALEEFRRGGYREIYVVGIPLEKGELLSEYGTYAEVGRASLEQLGAPTHILRAVPAPKVRRDRTFASAVALRDWLGRQGRTPGAFNVVTKGAHARRSRLLFAKAFGGSARIGIIAVPDEHYDETRWWRYSEGVRTVTDELIGYIYSRFFFSVAEDLATMGSQGGPEGARQKGQAEIRDHGPANVATGGAKRSAAPNQEMRPTLEFTPRRACAFRSE